MTRDDDLHQRRLRLVRAWSTYVEEGASAAEVRPEILASWQRSHRALPRGVTEAPLADEGETRAFWLDSPLQRAVSRVERELRRTAEDGDLVIAVTDPQTRILWTYGGRVLRTQAESVNFVPGSVWSDTAVGTNALDLATRTAAPATVFGAEHYAQVVHDWVCWAAPLHDPVSGELLGVVDLSTSWDRSHPIGLATARMAASLIESALPDSGRHPRIPQQAGPPEAGVRLRLLGAAEAWLDGRRLSLNRRQTEILALLALHPDGLSLERLHALLYGDQAVTFSTLKAEVSHLRAILGGRLSSRPYRLPMPVCSDVARVLDLLQQGRLTDAVAAYGGDVLPGTDSPALTELGEVVSVAVREALLADPRPAAVVRYSALVPYDTEVIEVCLALLGETPHPARALLKGRLAAARR